MKREWTIPFLVMVLFAILILTATANVLQQVQIKSLNDQVEILGLEADTFSAYMKDQNSINILLTKKVLALEAQNAATDLP